MRLLLLAVAATVAPIAPPATRTVITPAARAYCFPARRELNRDRRSTTSPGGLLRVCRIGVPRSIDVSCGTGGSSTGSVSSMSKNCGMSRVAGQAQQARHPPGPQRAGVADRVIVETAGDQNAGGGLAQLRGGVRAQLACRAAASSSHGPPDRVLGRLCRSSQRHWRCSARLGDRLVARCVRPSGRRRPAIRPRAAAPPPGAPAGRPGPPGRRRPGRAGGPAGSA